MVIPVKCAYKWLFFIYTYWFPALAAIVKHSAIGKVRLGKFNVRHHFEMGVQIVPHIIQVDFVGNQIRILLRPVPAQKLRCVLRRHGDCFQR